jgi:hypothetical protein
MGYFAILKDTNADSDIELEFPRCHINIWALKGLYGRRIVFDVGIAIRAKPPEKVDPDKKPTVPRSIRLALPFTVFGVDEKAPAEISEHSFEPLDEQILDQKSATLVFGEPVVVDGNHHTISFRDVVLRAARASATPAPGRRTLTGSVWTVRWDEDLLGKDLVNKELYLRMRFHPDNIQEVWSASSDGALFGLRICDARETSDSTWGSLDNYILPIDRLNVLAIVPAHLKQRAVSPAPKHVRLLEGESWEDYLKRKIQSGLEKKLGLGDKKLCVYHWTKVPKEKPEQGEKPEKIDARNPFQALLDLEKFPRGFGYGTTLLAMLVSIVVTVFVVVHTAIGTSTKTLVQEEWSVLRTAFAGVGAVALWQTIKWTFDKRDYVQRVPAWIRSIERWLYKHK